LSGCPSDTDSEVKKYPIALIIKFKSTGKLSADNQKYCGLALFFCGCNHPNLSTFKTTKVVIFFNINIKRVFLYVLLTIFKHLIMMIFYSIALAFYSLVIRILAPFHKKAKLMCDGRKNIFSRIESDIVKTDKHIWIHAASLGEFEQGRPVIEKIKNTHPDYKIVLTFFSPSGYEIRKNYEGADYIYYMPLDSASNAKRFIDIVKPEKAFFIKYEFWYFFLRELKRNNIPTYLFSTIFRENQIFFKPYGGLWRKMLSCFEHLFVQDDESIRLLKSIGVDNCSKAGDTRFDRVNDIASQAKSLALIEAFANDSKIAVCGSTWPKDEDNLLKFIKEDSSDYKWIIAPHETHKKHIEEILAKCDGEVLLYSDANEKNILDAKLLVIDCIGILSSVYQYADISYIGGGFGVGIHNTLEAATFGLPIVFGPNYLRFKEAVDMLALGAAFTYAEYENLTDILNCLVKDEQYRISCGAVASKYVKDNIGASKLIIDKSFS
jgi:3-deoxy-D-manno-octulosonic-acid transferase